MTLEMTRAEKAARATSLLADPLLMEAVATIRSEAVDEWCRGDDRAECRGRAQIGDSLRSVLQRYINDEKVAQHRAKDSDE